MAGLGVDGRRLAASSIARVPGHTSLTASLPSLALDAQEACDSILA